MVSSGVPSYLKKIFVMNADGGSLSTHPNIAQSGVGLSVGCSVGALVGGTVGAGVQWSDGLYKLHSACPAIYTFEKPSSRSINGRTFDEVVTTKCGFRSEYEVLI